MTALPLVLAQTEDTGGGMPWWAYIIWGWLFVSLAVYAYRIWRRFTGHTDAADRRGAKRVAATPPAPEGPSPTEALFLEAKAKQQGLTPPSGGAGAAPADADGPGADDSGRRGLFAAADAEPRPSKPVPELLQGITMPCELVPVTDEAVVDPTFHRVAFHTRTAGAADVGRELGDALEGLGYTLRSTSDAEAVATRGDDRLQVRIVARAGEATDERGGRRYPSIPQGDVVVEITS